MAGERRHVYLSPTVVDFEATWARLAEGVRNIITLVGTTGMPLYEDVYKICIAHPKPMAEDLYRRLQQFLLDHTSDLAQAIESSQSDLLTEYLKHWHNYSVGCLYCNRVFGYLNTHWIQKVVEESRHKLTTVVPPTMASSQEVYEVYSLCLRTWYKQIYNPVKNRLTAEVLRYVERDRNGEDCNTHHVTEFVNHLTKLGTIDRARPLEVYKSDYEKPFLEKTAEFYSREMAAFVAANGVSAAMQKAEARIEEEQLRSKKFLDSSSFHMFSKIMNENVIKMQRPLFLAECTNYLASGRISALSRAYGLLARIEGGVTAIAEIVGDWIIRSGREALRSIPAGDRNDPHRVVETLLTLHSRFGDVVKNSFQDDRLVMAALDRSCRVVINEKVGEEQEHGAEIASGGTRTQLMPTSPLRSPELLARYCDILLRKRRDSSDGDFALDEKLGQIIVLFKYLDEKDVFQTFYSKLLARRLLQGFSVSFDAESMMVEGLKQVCGFEYVNKLTRMFTDITVSTDIGADFQSSFLELPQNQPTYKLEFSVKVLTAGSWPLRTQGELNFSLLPEMQEYVKKFQEYYGHKHQGRKLLWLHHLSCGEVRFHASRHTYELGVSAFQMTLLLLFNRENALSANSIHELTGLPVQETLISLKSLVDSRVLVRHNTASCSVDKTEREITSTVLPLHQQQNRQPPSTGIYAEDLLVVNTSFSSKRLKLKLLGPTKCERMEDAPATYRDVDEDRRMYLQAAIVRVMKARRELKHLQLVQEVITQSSGRFHPNVATIKKVIEQLIEKEYVFVFVTSVR